jgi:hypothetical protein
MGKIRIEASIEDTFPVRDSSGRNFQALQVNREIFHAGVMDIVVAGCGATLPFSTQTTSCLAKDMIHAPLRRNRPRRSAARLVAHNEVYLVVQSIEASNQSIDRKFADATGDKRGNIRLLQPKHDGSLGLGKLPTFDDSPEFVNKLGLEKLFFRIGKTKVGEDVAAACGHFLVGAHLSSPAP